LVVDQKLTTRHDLLAEFGLTYRELDKLISRLGVVPTGSTTLGHRYAASEVNKIRAHFNAQLALSKRAVSVANAAQEIGCTRRTVNRFVALEQLQVDSKATDAAGMTMITRKSLDKLLQQRSKRATLPAVRPPGSIPILEAQERTGLTRVQVLKLRRLNVIIHRTPDYQFHVDEASLNAYFIHPTSVSK